MIAHLERNNKHKGHYCSLGSQIGEETDGGCDFSCRKLVWVPKKLFEEDIHYGNNMGQYILWVAPYKELHQYRHARIRFWYQIETTQIIFCSDGHRWENFVVINSCFLSAIHYDQTSLEFINNDVKKVFYFEDLFAFNEFSSIDKLIPKFCFLSEI